MKVPLKCEDCGYWWYNEKYQRETCNYFGPDEWAPCEQEEPEEEPDEY